MKILLVSEFFPDGKNLKFSGGVEARVFFIAKNLAKNNQVTILTSRIKGSKPQENMFGFKVKRVGPERKYSATVGSLFTRIAFTLSAVKTGKTQDAEIVEGSNFLTHFIAREIARKKNIRSVAWYPDVWIGSWVKNAGFFGLIGALIESFNLKRSFDAYIAISNSTAKKLSRFVKEKNIYVVPCGVDSKEFNQIKKNQEPTIICVSRLTKYKNVRILILAFALLKIKIKNAKLVIVGVGPQEKNLGSLSKELNLKDIIFRSNLPRKELINLISASHVFCLPSTVEGFGIAVIEAAAAGVPYVVSNIPVFREVTHEGKGGLFFKADSPEDLSKKLEKLLTDKHLYSKKVKEASFLVESYNWQEITNETEKIFKLVLKNENSSYY